MRPTLEVIESIPTGPATKPAILFVHGAGHGAWCWRPWMEIASAAGHLSYAVSLRGHAGSEGSLLRSHLDSYVDDVIRTAESLPGKVILVGHSLGGLVVQRTIARYEVEAAVLVAPVAARTGYRTLLAIARQHPLDALKIVLGGSLPMRHEYLFEALSSDQSAEFTELCGGESALAQFQVIFHRPAPMPLGDAPVLVLGTPEDNLIPLADVRDTAKRYAAPLVEFPGMGHDLMLDQGLEEPARAMLDWLGTAIPRAGAA